MYQCLAAVDIGSNTVHLIVAATDGQHLSILADESIFIRLADGVWNLGYIPDERILATTQAILHLREVAHGFGATQIVVVATEVARTARNTVSLLNAVHATTGLAPHVLSGMDEALLTFQGVTHGRQLPPDVAVADLGGGSLEINLVALSDGAWRTSLPLGSSFMHDRFILNDPPHEAEMQALHAYVTDRLATIPRQRQVEELIVCGGTVNALMRLVQQAQGRAMGDRVLRLSDLRHALDLMIARPYEIIAADFRLRDERARLLPTGAMILSALLDRLRLPGLIVSQAGIREGIVLAVARNGADWLAAARALGHHPPPPPKHAVRSLSFTTPIAARPTAEVAWQVIHDLAAKLLAYRKDALSGDTGAIHDMRVASRWLRTALETFAPSFAAVPLRRVMRAVKRVARDLGAVRDADVALADLRGRLAQAAPELVPGLRALIAARQRQRTAARRQLHRRLRTGRMDSLAHLVTALRLKPDQIVPPTAVRVATPAAVEPDVQERTP